MYLQKIRVNETKLNSRIESKKTLEKEEKEEKEKPIMKPVKFNYYLFILKSS